MVLAAGAAAGGFISGLAGFGTGLVAFGFWLYVVDPISAATLVAVCSVAAQAQTMPTIWHAVDRARVAPMVLAGVLGVPVGTMLLYKLDPGFFRLGVGLLLVGYSGFMLLGRAQPRLAWSGQLADGAIGFAGGVLGGVAGLSGPSPTAWATMQGWSKDQARGVFQVFNLVVLAAVIVWHVASGLLTAELGWLGVVAVPGTSAGAWLGIRAYRRLSDKRFREIVPCLLGLSGLALVWASR